MIVFSEIDIYKETFFISAITQIQDGSTKPKDLWKKIRSTKKAWVSSTWQDQNRCADISGCVYTVLAKGHPRKEALLGKNVTALFLWSLRLSRKEKEAGYQHLSLSTSWLKVQCDQMSPVLRSSRLHQGCRVLLLAELCVGAHLDGVVGMILHTRSCSLSCPPWWSVRQNNPFF